jgi:flagellar protein FlaE
MSINPRDYDLDELRKMARERGGGPNGADADGDEPEWNPLEQDAEEMVGSSSFRAGLYRELLPLQAGADGLTKPYLRVLPQNYAGEYLVFEWLEFLLLHAGFQGATDALEYYESVEWLTEDVKSSLRDYLMGIDEEAAAAEANDLDVDDHMLSLVYIAKLVSTQ